MLPATRAWLAAVSLAVVLQAQDAGRPADYFQQSVAYRIAVTLNDLEHTLSAHLSLDYTNHSPDTLENIWFHLWPNAYRNNETAFARQLLSGGSTRFHFATEDERGFIDSLDFSSAGESLKWSYHPEWIDVANVLLAEPLPPGGTVTIETPFFVKIPGPFSRMGHKKNHYEISQWYPKPAVYDRDGWHPMPYLNRGEFYSEFGSFDVTITLPQEYVIMATGDLPEGDPEYAFLDSLAGVTDGYYNLTDEEGNPDKAARAEWMTEWGDREFAKPGSGPTKILRFRQEKVHDFAWFADKRYMVRRDSVWTADSSRAITAWTLYRAGVADLWEEATEYIRDTIHWYGQWYGEYPYNHATAVSGDLLAGGGMEYPNITVISIGGPKELLEIVVMHEVGHNWFYGIFGFNERLHPWMDEGLNSYSEIRYWKAKYDGLLALTLPGDLMRRLKSPVLYQDFQRALTGLSVGSVDDQPMETPAADVKLMNYGAMFYNKPALVFSYLERYLGVERNRLAWNLFSRRWSFAHPGPRDLQASFEEAAGEDLSWLFEDIINTTRRMDYGVRALSREGDEVIVQLSNYGNLTTPLEVATLDKEGNILQTRWVPGFAGEQTVAFPAAGVVSATTDPYRISPDVQPGNNHNPLLRLPGLILQKPALAFLLNGPRPDRTQFLYIPFLTFNALSGVAPGLILGRGFLPPIRRMFIGSLYYDIPHQQFFGTAGMTARIYRKLGVDEITFKAVYRDKRTFNDTRFGLRAIFRERAVSTPRLDIDLYYLRQALASDRFSPSYWDLGSLTSLVAGVTYRDNSNPLLRWSLHARGRQLSGTVDSDVPDVQGVIVEGSGVLRLRYSSKGSIRLRAWAGQAISGAETIPRQYRFWLSGGLDPELANLFGTNRSSAGPLAVYEQLFFPDAGPGMRILNRAPPGSSAWSLNVDLASKLPADIFFDAAGTGSATYLGAGLRLRLPALTVILPVWDNWSASQGLSYVERIRLSIDVSVPGG